MFASSHSSNHVSVYFNLELHPYLDRVSKMYGSPIKIWLGPFLVVFITDAENVEIVMKSKDCINKPHTFYKIVQEGLGVDGLITLNGICDYGFVKR